MWPNVPDPDAPSPMTPGRTNAEAVAADIVAKGAVGIPTFLKLGFVINQGPRAEPYVRRWGEVLAAAGAAQHIHAIAIVDDSNGYVFVPRSRYIADRTRFNRLVKEAFPAVALRGHDHHVVEWGRGGKGAFAPLPPEMIGLPDETAYFIYDYRQDGTHACPQDGDAPSPDDPGTTATRIRDDVRAFLETASRSAAGPLPTFFTAKSYLEATCGPNDPARERVIACKYADLWARLRADREAGRLPIVGFFGFAYHDHCGSPAMIGWKGTERSPQLSAALSWVGQNR